MKKTALFSLFLSLGFGVMAKPVDVTTAKRVGFNFLSMEMNAETLRTADDLQLVYTSQSSTGAASYFYVFNLQNDGFVMVAADDQSVPVFAYSKETGFDPHNIPPAATTWLDNYTSEIRYIIEHNSPATNEISEKWATLLTYTKPTNTGNKTTVSGTPLLTTKWNQSPNYNELCPFDAGQNKLSVTGCVATAMAQIMKYWNYPLHGTGSHSYYSNYGLESADFANTTYQWANMPNGIGGSNNAVATLMYHCGVAVDMNYSPSSSGAIVVDAMGPQSAESALANYFGYNVNAIFRSSMSTQAWINKFKTEIDNNRPIIYAGFGQAGGHCWIADAYDKNDYMHINWGWGGASDGYYSVDNMNPPALGVGGGTGGFYSGQHAIVGIQPASMPAGDKYENNNIEAQAYNFPVTGAGTTNILTTGSTLHTTNDIDYYSIFLPVGDNYTVTARLHDSKSSANGNTYTLDAKLGYKGVGAGIWSSYFDDILPATLDIKGGGTIYFRVAPQVTAETGTYLLDVNVTRVATGVADINKGTQPLIYPNPAASNINIDLGNASGKASISIIDIQGREVVRTTETAGKVITIPVNNLSNGMYFVRIQSDNGTYTEKISISK